MIILGVQIPVLILRICKEKIDYFSSFSSQNEILFIILFLITSAIDFYRYDQEKNYKNYKMD